MPQGVSYQGVFGGAAPMSGMRMRRSFAQNKSYSARAISGFAAPESAKFAEEAEDVSFAAPGMMADSSSTAEMCENEAIAPEFLAIEVVSVTGLDTAATAALTKHLQEVELPAGFSGEVVFEFTINKGRVLRLMLDEEKSTLTDGKIIYKIRISLLAWHPTQSTSGTVSLTLRVHS
ncbi:MAG: after-VIT domain-containing protein [Oscillatoria sp. PMC 1051.18]|nr:after-VIT domain-containing protein [Oscillatoria sp. PMC 1050.18]MEC5030395.1 after-VIT domain-containing protein [Oscillatoria sp. PMC 1051.18]